MSFIDFFGNVVRKKDVYFKYSTDEQWTGEYWIDGKKIYCKVVSVSGFTKDKYVAHNISNLHRILSCDLFVMFNDGTNHMMPRQDKRVDCIFPQRGAVLGQITAYKKARYYDIATNEVLEPKI